MKILGIDTSSYLNSVCLVDDEQVLANCSWEAMDNSLQPIIRNIDSVLTGQGLTLADIEGLGVCLGPGSWTGVRVGVTVGKTLAYAAGKPVCGVSSLDALAYQAKDAATRICPLLDGGKETVYGAFYRPEKGTVSRTGEYYSGDLKELLDMVEEITLFSGPAARIYRGIITDNLGSLACYSDNLEDIERSSAVALLTLSRLKRGDKDDALSLAPLYLRESAAQARLAGG